MIPRIRESRKINATYDQKFESGYSKHTLSNTNEYYEELVEATNNLRNMYKKIESNALQ